MLFKDLLGKKTLFFDGAMGTMLQVLPTRMKLKKSTLLI